MESQEAWELNPQASENNTEMSRELIGVPVLPLWQLFPPVMVPVTSKSRIQNQASLISGLRFLTRLSVLGFGEVR